MGDITSDCTIELCAGIGHTFKTIKVLTPTTTDTADTFTYTLADAGATQIIGVKGFVQTTEGSVVEQEQPTTSVTTGTLTVTVGGSTVSDKARYYEIEVK